MLRRGRSGVSIEGVRHGPDNDLVRGGKRRVDAVIAALAEGQHGVVARRQLLALGVGSRAIDHRVATGRLHLLHRGVYAVGHRVVSQHGWWMGALLSAGPEAVLSHRSAAALWGIRQTTASRIDVTLPRWVRRRAGIAAHQAVLPADETTIRQDIPVTAASRTLLDLATVLAPRQLERAIEEAEALRLPDALTLDDLVARYPGRPGTPAVRRVLDAGHVGATLTRSELEERFLAFLDEHGFARPKVNAWLETAAGWFEVDCLWREERVVVELDGYTHHGTRAAFERDRARDRALQAVGWRVVRITWRQLIETPLALAKELRAILDPTLTPS